MTKKNKPKLTYRKGLWECYAATGCFGYGRTPVDAWTMYIKCAIHNKEKVI